jgi:hypothetical protein
MTRKRKSSNRCVDCGQHHFKWPAYMVEDAVWAAAGYSPTVEACPACLVRRLGRDLQPEDLNPCAAGNYAFRNDPGKLLRATAADMAEFFEIAMSDEARATALAAIKARTARKTRKTATRP